MKTTTRDNDCVCRARYMFKDCEAKKRYSSRMESEEAVRSYYLRVVLSIHPMVSYWCSKHDCFHIGHQRSSAEIRKYKEMLNSIGYMSAA